MTGIPERTRGEAMSESHRAANCRWAVPTLFLAPPAWIDASDRPWTCVRDAVPREMETTDACGECVRWEPHSAAAAGLNEQDRQHEPKFFLDILTN